MSLIPTLTETARLTFSGSVLHFIGRLFWRVQCLRLENSLHICVCVKCCAMPNFVLSDLVSPHIVFELGRGQPALVYGLWSNQQLNWGVQPHVVPPSCSLHLSLSLHQHANGCLISSLFLDVSHFSRTHFPWRLNILSAWTSHFLFLYILLSLVYLFLGTSYTVSPSFFAFPFDAAGWCIQLTTSFNAFSQYCINPDPLDKNLNHSLGTVSLMHWACFFKSG